MKLKKLTPEEETILLAKIKNGTAKQVHFGLNAYKSIFRPRGSMQKNSVGAYLLEKLTDGFEQWTNPKYADNPDLEKLIQSMHHNMMVEVISAWEAFIRSDKTASEFKKAGL